MVQHGEYDVVIVGAGLAGLTVALSLPTYFRIALLLKNDLYASSSYWAQGGIAAVLTETDRLENHVENTLNAGAGLCDVDNTQKILAQAPEAIAWLQQQGVIFDLDQSANTPTLHLTKEGGHDHRRIVHVADHTGKSVIQALVEQLEDATNIECLVGYDIEEILTKNRHCYGLRCKQGRQQYTFIAQQIVLATGGVGQLFERTTNPITAKGDGLALAFKAGCRIVNLECIQFHPTGLALPHADGFLISEALRGEGGILRNATGHRFMPNYDARAELAPRDIVARAIFQEMKKQQNQPVYLDMTHLDDVFIQQHFPEIYAKCCSLGLDMCQQMIPVAPTAHYSCGGVLTDAVGHTDIQNLYAVGEVACTGLHGANRLASNSLLECIVVGRNIAQDVVAQNVWAYPTVGYTHTFKPLSMPVVNRSAETFSHQTLQQWMSHYLGIVRTQQGLEQLYLQLKAWQSEHPTSHSILVALLMATGALSRLESRGAHFNEDYPKVSKEGLYSLNID
ncbi:L-aspartate oxidase [Acinetobacter boissieri]|uniref:L-aspartate oxidase n=1 Tax=Acinetobacter boissieri TaxID=1219383 RepID=A0A1G6GHL6_9GAMM|nr:L-aspartate oxidase [Acinetobacter boissieri]SDB81333.1 L-aspartate oxidase [Acinetobacter boissieri]